jgi:hypothetical protein
MGIVDMLAAHIGARCRDAASTWIDDLDDLVRVKRTADADTPINSCGVPAGRLDVTAGVNEEVARARIDNDLGRVSNCPALDNS